MSGENLSSLLSDPALLSSIASLISSMPIGNRPAQPSTAAESGTTPTQPPPPPPAAENGNRPTQPPPDNGTENRQNAAAGMPDMSGILSAAMKNPELLAALPSMMSALSGMFGSQKSGGATADAQTASGALPALAAFPGAQSQSYPRPPRPTDRRSALLLALKPYMPEDKRDTVDTIVRVIEILSLIK